MPPFSSARGATLALSLVCALAGSSLGVRAEDKPPQVAPGSLVTDYHGVAVADPYRDLENHQSPEVKAWAEAHAAHARRRLDALPGLGALRERIAALDRERQTTVVALEITPRGQWFALKRPPDAGVARLYVRDRADAPERLLLDPERWARETGVSHSINNLAPSPDGRFVAVVIAKGDAELGEMRVFDARSGQQVGPSIPGIWGEMAASWQRDSRSFRFVRGGEALRAGGKPFGKMTVHLRNVSSGDSTPLWGWEAQSATFPARERDWLYADATSSAQFQLAMAFEGVGGVMRLAFAPQVARGDANRSTPAWQPLFDVEAGVKSAALWRHWLYVRSFKDAPRYRILRYDLRRPSAPPVPVVEEGTGVIESMAAAADGLYYVVRTGAVGELLLLPHGRAGAGMRVPLPHEGTLSLWAADSAVPGVIVSLEGWTRELQVLRVRGNTVTRSDLVPPSGSSVGADWVAEEANCTSHDGVQVPMSLVYKRGLIKDGSHPTLLNGYGGYGWTENAAFLRTFDPLFQRGGVFVDVKPRGGGAFGREWYQAGVGPRKHNTWKDMIACARALIERGYTSSAKLTVQGRSMGGVAAGRAMTDRPDLFAGAILRVGVLDAVRFIEATANGPNHELEMGSLASAEGAQQLVAMSTYHHIKDGEPYPATLFTVGLNDNRVAPWLSLKAYARLAAASTSGKPVLLRIDELAGHGVTAPEQQRIAELADRIAFVLWTAGDPEFQPADRR